VIVCKTRTGVSFIIDNEDQELVAGLNWYASQGKYIMNDNTGYLHRILMGCVPGDKKIVDHINGDTLDNRKQNLRVVTQSENAHNGAPRGGTSTHRGVALDKRSGKWEAYIWQDYKKSFLGYYDTEEEAIARRRQEENIRGVMVYERN